MIISYQLPCSYSYYAQLLDNQEVTPLLSTVIAGCSVLETIHPNLTLLNLRFKKFMLLEPRYFHYLKYQNSTGSSHWEICISTKSKHSSQVTEKECELSSICCLEECQEQLILNSYIEVDLKSNIRARKVVHRVCE